MLESLKDPKDIPGDRLLAARLGHFVVPFGTVGFRATRMVNSEAGLALTGRTLTGKIASKVVTNAVTDFVPSWAIRLASVVITSAWGSDFNQMIRTLIVQHGLPVDDSIVWDPIIRQIFHSVGLKADAEVEEAAQLALVTALVFRDGLAKFDPDFKADRPLEKRVTAYIIHLFEWQARGRGEAGEQTRDQRHLTILDAPIGEGSDETVGSGIADPDALTPEDHALRVGDIHSLVEFRRRFGAYLQNRRTEEQIKAILILFDLVTSAHDGQEITTRWMTITKTSYSNLRRILNMMREELVKFVNTKHAPNTRLTQIINEIRSRVMDVQGINAKDVEGLGLGEEDSVGTKAKAMVNPSKVSASWCK